MKTRRNNWLTSVCVVVTLSIGFLSACGKAKDGSQEYARQLVPGSLQVLGNAEKIWFFIEFEQLYCPLRKAQKWDHPGFTKKGARQWIIEYKVADAAINVREMDGSISRRLSWNPNLSRLFVGGGSWYALKTESMFTQAAIYRMSSADGTFQLLSDHEPGFGLPDAPGYQQKEYVNGVSAKSGLTYLHSSIGISEETFSFGDFNYTLQLKSEGDCYKLLLLKDARLVGDGSVLSICPEAVIVTEEELKGLPDFMSGKPKTAR